MAVTIQSFQVKKNQKGEEFVVLNLVSEIVLEKSANTGNVFASTYKANIIAAFDADTAKLLVGTKLPGAIIKKEVPPYEFTVKSTGKKMILKHTFEYVQNGLEVYHEVPRDFDNLTGDPTL